MGSNKVSSFFIRQKKNTQHLPPYLNQEMLCCQNTTGALILTSLSARLHHHPTSHSIKRIRNQPCYCRDSLGNHPAHYDMHILWIRQHTCHQEQRSRVSTGAKGCGTDSCGRNNHPPTPGVSLARLLTGTMNETSLQGCWILGPKPSSSSLTKRSLLQNPPRLVS